MIVGIRVEAENIQTGKVKHCNSSYFTMVAKTETGESAVVPGLILSTTTEIRRFHKALKLITLKKEKDVHEEEFDHTSEESFAVLKNYNVLLEVN